MSQVDNLHDLFRVNGNRLTLGQILDNWKLVGSKYTNRISELEARLELEGKTIKCTQDHSQPTRNVYEIVRFMEPGGQGLLA